MPSVRLWSAEYAHSYPQAQPVPSSYIPLPYAYADSHTNAYVYPHADSHSLTNAYVHPHADSHSLANAYVYPHADSDSLTNAYVHPHADPHSLTNANAYPHADSHSLTNAYTGCPAENRRSGWLRRINNHHRSVVGTAPNARGNL